MRNSVLGEDLIRSRKPSSTYGACCYPVAAFRSLLPVPRTKKKCQNTSLPTPFPIPSVKAAVIFISFLLLHQHFEALSIRRYFRFAPSLLPAQLGSRGALCFQPVPKKSH